MTDLGVRVSSRRGSGHHRDVFGSLRVLLPFVAPAIITWQFARRPMVSSYSTHREIRGKRELLLKGAREQGVSA